MSKTPKYAGLIEAYINERINQVITPAQITEAVQCTAPTTYAFIKNNPSRFEKISAGQYRVLSSANSSQSAGDWS
jgi:hypothetical protein